MSTERDELTAIIDDRWHGYGYNPQGAADAILAAGYLKHSEELAKYKRGAKTLGEIIEKQCRDVLDVTGLHHLINEDGDGAWDVVWFRLFEMRDELASLKESTIGRERVRGDSWRDRAQEMDSRAQSLEVELQAAKPQQVATVDEQTRQDALQDSINAALNRLKMASIGYSLQQGVFVIGKDECPPRIEGDKPHCPDCSGIVGETGVVW